MLHFSWARDPVHTSKFKNLRDELTECFVYPILENLLVVSATFFSKVTLQLSAIRHKVTKH